jgi:hypothetical protein
MSGGSFDYAYTRLDELDRWSLILADMASRCREWAASDKADTKYDRELKKNVPTTMDDRAHVLVRAMLLDKAAGRLRRAVDEVKMLKDLMHDVEWVVSGDYGVDRLMGPLKEED